MISRSIRAAVAVAAVSAVLPCLAQDKPEKRDWTFRPVVIEAKDGVGATLALDYQLKGEIFRRDFTKDDSASPVLDPDAVIGAAVVGYAGKGTVAASKERNPRNFLDLLLDLKYRRSSSAGSYDGGAFVKYEADQSFESKQAVYGAHLAGAKLAIFSNSDFAFGQLNYGRVDPSKDAARKAVLGDRLRAYYRWDAEVLYLIPVKVSVIDTLEVNYRYFQELAPPGEIKRAGLDVFKLATARLGLPHGVFVAYSTGKLPFDRTKDRVFEMGWTYKIP